MKNILPISLWIPKQILAIWKKLSFSYILSIYLQYMRVDSKTKFFYGMGFISVGIKDILYAVFVFFYFSQILGLDQIYTGTATLIALLFDAVSDPIIGTISDNYKSKKYGRRHPFMAMSAIPLGISTYLLFKPFDDLGQFELFLWMTFFSILIRFFLSLFWFLECH